MAKLEIDGPAGRNEVTDKYRNNYDQIFRRPKDANKAEGSNGKKSH